jgi:phenylpyruvate tautomerase PptA (4-oxalocrotonate tautomerase family)
VPTLHVHLAGKPTRRRQRALVRRLTEAVCRSVGKKPEDVTIYLYCHAGGAQEMAFAGVLHSERKTKGR